MNIFYLIPKKNFLCSEAILKIFTVWIRGDMCWLLTVSAPAAPYIWQVSVLCLVCLYMRPFDECGSERWWNGNDTAHLQTRGGHIIRPTMGYHLRRLKQRRASFLPHTHSYSSVWTFTHISLEKPQEQVWCTGVKNTMTHAGGVVSQKQHKHNRNMRV